VVSVKVYFNSLYLLVHYVSVNTPLTIRRLTATLVVVPHR